MRSTGNSKEETQSNLRSVVHTTLFTLTWVIYVLFNNTIVINIGNTEENSQLLFVILEKITVRFGANSEFLGCHNNIHTVAKE